MTYAIAPGSTSRSVFIRIYKDTGKLNTTPLVYNSTGLAISYHRDNAAAVSIPLVTLATATAAFTAGGFIHVGNGEYRVDVPDAAWASGASVVSIVVADATDINAEPCVVQLNYPADIQAMAGNTAAPIVMRGWYGNGATGSLQSATTTNLVLSASAATVDNTYRDWWLVLTSGTLSQFARRITSYNGTSKTASLDKSLPSAPATGTTYTLVPAAAIDVSTWLEVAPAALNADGTLPDTAAATTAFGTIGTNLDVKVSTRSTFDPTVSGVNATKLGGQTVTAVAPVTVPASIGDATATGQASLSTNVSGLSSQISNLPSVLTSSTSLLAAIATAVEGHLIDENDGQQLLQAIVSKINATDVNLAGLSTSAIATAVANYLLSNATTPGTLGYVIGHTLDATMSSRSTYAGGNVVVGGYAVGQSPADLVTATTIGNVTIAGYASGQDPATLLLNNPTYKLATDVNGRVGVNNFPVEFLTSAEQTELTTTINDLNTLLGRTDTAGTIATISSNIGTLMTRIGSTLSIVNGKVAATMDASNVTGILSVNTIQWAGGAVGGVPLSSLGTVAPQWYTAPDNADVVQALQNLVTLVDRTDPSTALAAIREVVEKFSFDTQNNVRAVSGAGSTFILKLQELTSA